MPPLWELASQSLVFGWQTAFAINPPRDLGPGIMSAAVGYPNAFTFGNYYCLVRIFAPIFGTIIGASIHTILIDSGSKENAFWADRLGYLRDWDPFGSSTLGGNATFRDLEYVCF